MNAALNSRIMVVDDDISCLKAFEDILCPEFSLYSVKNGRDVFKLVEKIMPDVILLNIAKSEFNGYSVFAELKGSKKTRDIPVIFISKHCDVQNEKTALSYGAADYIRKPFDPDILKLRIQYLIKSKNRKYLLLERKLAETENRVQAEFISRVSEEVHGHMNTILEVTHTLRMSDCPDDAKDHLDAIDAASRQVLRLMECVPE